ncbi:MAG: tryptophan synthase subunit alpha [Actinomycetota bacterium]|nr:tryptophan synthase subunit alpha [Actinomycetota bacterium]
MADAFAGAREQGRAALMPYLMGGFPDTEGAVAVARAYADAGADLIELGIPFSDPLADGPVIHAAATRALKGGATLDSALEAGAAVAGTVPVVAMVYANMVLACGPGEFAAKLADAGAAGAIVPDLPLEEADQIRAALNARGLGLVPLVAPTTPPERRLAISRSAQGFVYLVSTLGVTGERDQLPAELTELIEAVRADSEAPVAVGFGIGTADQAAAVGQFADGIIIGSRLVRIASEQTDISRATEALSDFLAEVRGALAGTS